MILLTALAAAVQMPPDSGPAWATLTIEPQLQRTRTEIRFGSHGFDRMTQGPIYWARREHRGFRETPVVQWAHARDCPTLGEVIGAMATVAVPSVAPPGIDGDDMILTLDGTLFRLEAPARFTAGNAGRVVMESNTGSPLAAWAGAVEAKLGACWK